MLTLLDRCILLTYDKAVDLGPDRDTVCHRNAEKMKIVF